MLGREGKGGSACWGWKQEEGLFDVRIKTHFFSDVSEGSVVVGVGRVVGGPWAMVQVG